MTLSRSVGYFHRGLNREQPLSLFYTLLSLPRYQWEEDTDLVSLVRLEINFETPFPRLLLGRGKEKKKTWKNGVGRDVYLRTNTVPDTSRVQEGDETEKSFSMGDQ